MKLNGSILAKWMPLNLTLSNKTSVKPERKNNTQLAEVFNLVICLSFYTCLCPQEKGKILGNKSASARTAVKGQLNGNKTKKKRPQLAGYKN